LTSKAELPLRILPITYKWVIIAFILIFAIPHEATAQSLIRQQIQEDYDQLYKEKSPDFGENRCFFTERPETCYITYEKVWWVDINQLILQSLS